MKLRRVLLPLSPIYWLITRVRNWLYDIGKYESRSFDVPVICVGNVTVGGTGKTPLVELLTASLSEKKRVGIVSRGYGRKTKGQIVATDDSTAEEIGDEPCQIKGNYPEAIMVVDADRAAAIDKAVSLGAEVVIMDDGMQHRSVRPGLTICVCDYARPMYADFPLPGGDLREPWAARHRADIIIINKCPEEMTEAEADEIRRKMRLRDGQEIFFAAIGYGMEVPREHYLEPYLYEYGEQTPVLAVAGIGRPEPFFEELESRYETVRRMKYPDHYNFDSGDQGVMEDELEELGGESVLICTEKDSKRMPKIGGHEVYFLPIETIFLFDQEEKFIELINTRLCL